MSVCLSWLSPNCMHNADLKPIPSHHATEQSHRARLEYKEPRFDAFQSVLSIRSSLLRTRVPYRRVTNNTKRYPAIDQHPF